VQRQPLLRRKLPLEHYWAVADLRVRREAGALLGLNSIKRQRAFLLEGLDAFPGLGSTQLELFLGVFLLFDDVKGSLRELSCRLERGLGLLGYLQARSGLDLERLALSMGRRGRSDRKGVDLAGVQGCHSFVQISTFVALATEKVNPLAYFYRSEHDPSVQSCGHSGRLLLRDFPSLLLSQGGHLLLQVLDFYLLVHQLQLLTLNLDFQLGNQDLSFGRIAQGGMSVGQAVVDGGCLSRIFGEGRRRKASEKGSRGGAWPS